MLEELNQHQYNVLFQSLFFDVLVGKTFFNTLSRLWGNVAILYVVWWFC
jgi:hypothetical protein